MTEGLKELYLQIQRDAHGQEIELGGMKFTTKPVHPVLEPSPECIEVTTLTGLIDYLKGKVDGLDLGKLVCHVENPTTVTLRSTLTGPFMQRHEYIRAKADLPEMHFVAKLDAEAFNIWVQSAFVADEHRSLVLKFAANVKSTVEGQSLDDGVSQVVSVRTGIVSVENVVIPNPVRLAPYRTFTEIAQPESDFIFRAHTGNLFSLTEADGGAWRSDAMQNLKAYIENEIEGLIVIA